MPTGLSILVVVVAIVFAIALLTFAWKEAKAIRERARDEAAAAERDRDAAVRQAATTRSDALLIREQADAELERIGGLSRDEARRIVEDSIVDEARRAANARLRVIEADAKANAEQRARAAIVTAAERIATPTSSQAAITVVRLPNEEMKGRIIGKEGRNIRTFEAITGVNLIIDETPQIVSLSSFDPERREIAEAALDQLVADGRIHPQRIEDAYAKARAGADERAVAAGAAACERAGVSDLDPELVRILGLLRLRTSFGQNVLAHLVEAATIGGAAAAELGADEAVVRRAALLHDIGKSVDGAEHGSHAAIGARLAERFGEAEIVVNAIAAHHDEVPAASLEATLVQIADAASASRPGARRDEADQFFERIARLEELAASYQGVTKVLAMSSGRDVRVVVEPNEVNDEQTFELATAIARRLQDEGTVPGQIRVTVVRELRAEATA